MGGLICWENYMPLARYALAAWGAQIHVAPTWDRGEPWLSTMRHTAKEGRAVVVSCCQAVRLDDIPDDLPFKAELTLSGHAGLDQPGRKRHRRSRREDHGWTGDRSGNDHWYADVRRDDLVGPFDRSLDIAGHYARPDVFELIVHRRSAPMIRED